MNLNHYFFSLSLLLLLASNGVIAQESENRFEPDTVKFTRDMLPPKYVVDTRIDNMGYWKKMAEAGLVPVAPNAIAPAPLWHTTKIMAPGFAGGNSPDVTVTTSNTTQSENSIFLAPGSSNWLFNSNNSTPQPSTGSFYGTSGFYSDDSATTWNGQYQGTGGGNSGDPSVVINNNGRWFNNFIANSGGQGIAYSDNQGTTWTTKTISSGSTDKNHMWIDNTLTSPYLGNLYVAWMENNATNISRSLDNGLTWKPKINISNAVNAGSHNQGVNIKTGPDGQVYVAWAVYDSWPADEKAIGFARSVDGGATYAPAIRAINNIKGIRNHGTGKNMRVNSFPSMAVDLSNGPKRGTIYIVWSNVNTPGVNSGNGIEVYLIKSTDQGVTWSIPVKVNTDPIGTGKQHYFGWITCDESNGNLAIVFYDDRNVTATQAEVWCAVSIDGGETFTDFLVSDVSFTPSPIPNMATSYMGDYLGITSKNGVVYPCWTDTRSGHAMTYVSPFLLTPAMNQAYIAYQGHLIGDFTPGGNGNGVLDYGENILLTLSVKNIGDKPDTNVMVTLSSDSPYLTFTDSTENYGNFAIGEIKSVLNGFAFHVSDSIPNGTELVFNVKAVNNLDSVNYSYFTIIANAPQLTIGNIVINDPAGNNNHILDPGESADIVVSYTNNSMFDASNAVSHLTCAQPFVTVLTPAVNLGTVTAGQTVTATFPATVSTIPFGSAAQFTNLVNYSFQSSQKSFLESIGLIVEDWETGTFTKFPWSFAGNNNWEIDNLNMFEGNYSARSGAITHNQSVSLNLDYNVMFNDSISFYRKVSSELFHDVLSFFIDNVRVGQWSGIQTWKRMAYPILAGPHTFKWEYSKDASGSVGDDAAWVDFVVFPPEQRSMSFAGNNVSTCEGLPVQLNAYATHYQSLLWSTSGTGTFSDNTILDPVYTPSQADIAAGSVTLTLTVTGISAGETAVSSLLLTINPKPTAVAGSDASVCNGTALTIVNASATNYSGLTWGTSGDGTFSDPASLLPAYTPGTSDKTAGFVALYLMANTGNACLPASDTLQLVIHALPVVQLAATSMLCQGDSTQLTYTISGLAPFSAAMAGGEIMQIPSSPWSEWIKPSATATYTVNSVTDANGCTGTDVATTTIQIKPSPVLHMPADTALCGNLVLKLASNAVDAVSYLWSPGGQTTTTASIDTTGIGLGIHTYTLVATASNGCTTTRKTDVSFYDCTGVEEFVGNVKFAIYPNPSNGQFAIYLASANREDVNIRIVNSSGATVYQLNELSVNGSLTKSFDLKYLSQGTYLLLLENQTTKVTKQLVIVK